MKKPRLRAPQFPQFRQAPETQHGDHRQAPRRPSSLILSSFSKNCFNSNRHHLRQDQLCDGCTIQRVVCLMRADSDSIKNCRSLEVCVGFASRAVRIDQNKPSAYCVARNFSGVKFLRLFQQSAKISSREKKSANIFSGKFYSRDKYSWPVHRRCFIVLFDNLRARRRNVCFRRLTSEVI